MYATEKQIHALKKFRIPVPRDLSRAQASRLLGEAIRKLEEKKRAREEPRMESLEAELKERPKRDAYCFGLTLEQYRDAIKSKETGTVLGQRWGVPKESIWLARQWACYGVKQDAGIQESKSNKAESVLQREVRGCDA